MKFTKRQQAFIDSVQTNPKTSPQFRAIIGFIPTAILLSLIWSHWFGGPEIVFDFAYALVVLNVLIVSIFGSIMMVYLCRADGFDEEGRQNADRLLFSPWSPLFRTRLQNIQNVIFYLGGFVILVAAGHGILATALVIAGVVSYLFHAVFIRDGKMRLDTIDTASISYKEPTSV